MGERVTGKEVDIGKEVKWQLRKTEIGSIYEINPETVPAGEGPGALFSLKETEKYGKSNIAFTASGRSAIALALKSFARNRGQRNEMKKAGAVTGGAGTNGMGAMKRCLLPAYMCDTVFFPFQWEGWEIGFYHINKNLEADAEELSRLMEEMRPNLLFIHPYYGVDTWKPMRPLLKEWRAQGICIMKDVTQSYYLENAGEEADYVVGSLRKWYPIPDGGFAASNEPLAWDVLASEEEFAKRRLDCLMEKWAYLYGSRSREEKKAMKEDFLKKNREMEAWMDVHRGIGALSKVSAGILGRANEKECRNRRNGNYRYLCEKLEGKSEEKSRCWPILPRLWGEEEKSAAPLYFPVYAKDRNGLQKFLAERNIYAPVLWPVGRENEGCLTEDERFIYSHMLALPMDQRYGKDEMERISKALEEYEGE